MFGNAARMGAAGRDGVVGDEFGSDTEQNLKTGGDGAKSYGWNLLNNGFADTIDVHSSNAGFLTMALNSTSTGDWWQANENGVYVFKDISGNFDVETLTVNNADQMRESAGLVVRDPDASVGKDSLVAFSHWGNTGLEVRFYNITNSSGVFYAAVNTDKHFRITRVGNVFKSYHKTNPGDSWIERASDTRSDFASTVQVGLMAYSNNSAGNFIAQFDYIRFN